MQWQTAAPDPSGDTDVAVARAFIVAGLIRSFSSPQRLSNAILRGELVTWRRTRRPEMWQVAGGFAPELAGLSRSQAFDLPPGDSSLAGLRLLSSLAIHRLSGGGPEELRRILGHPGYESAVRRAGFLTGMASFVADFSFFSGWDNEPALSWPLHILAQRELLSELSGAHAVIRGLASLEQWPVERPDGGGRGRRLIAHLVDFDEDTFHGEALALRFVRAGRPVRPLPARLTFEHLQQIEPVVFFRLNGTSLAERLTGFIYELSHNRPVDVAAWETMRWEPEDRRLAPLVIAPRRFLLRARVSDVIPALQSRLRRLNPDLVFPLSPQTVRGFGPFVQQEIEDITVRRLADLLTDVGRLAWNHESDTATSIIDVDRGIEALEHPVSDTVPPVSDAVPPDSVKSGHNGGPPESPAPSMRGPILKSPPPPAAVDSLESASISQETTGEVWRPPDPLEQLTPPPNPPRYTDIAILDPDQRVHEALEPLVALTTYTLEVAIRGKRRGLTKDRTDQPSIDLIVPPQVKAVSVWAVISDETEGESGIAQQLFSFDRKFAEFKLPPAGDSIDSALFKFTARPGRIALNRPRSEVCPRIGIRLYHKLNLIDHLQLDLRFEHAPGAAASPTEDPAVRVTFQHPSGEPAAVEPPNPASAPRALTISVSKSDTPANGYRFAVAAGSKERPGEPVLSGTKKLSEDELNDFVARFRELLLPTVFGAALGQVSLPDKDRDELLKNLSLLGSEIVTRLFDFSPGGDFFELGAMVRDALPDMSIIQISLSEDTKDFVFPWQTLTVNPSGDADAAADPNNLWGYRFIIEVKRRGDGVDLRGRTALPPGPARMAYARWHFKNEPQHSAALAALATQAKVPVQWTAPIIESRADFIDVLTRGGGDLVYVYAHGHAAAPNTPLGTRYRDNAQQQIKAVAQRMKSNPMQQSMTQNEGWTDLEEQFLNLTRAGAESSLTLSKSEVGLTSLLVAIGGSRSRLADAPIVFLNTCESAQIWNAVDGSFVGFFLDRGARAVVGTESTIPIVLADAFGREALMHLFAGDSLGEAVFKARLTLLQSSKNPLGLCYCIYGAADTRLGSDPLAG